MHLPASIGKFVCLFPETINIEICVHVVFSRAAFLVLF